MGLTKGSETRRSAIVGFSIGVPAAVLGGIVMRAVDGAGGFALGVAVAALFGLTIGLVLRSRLGAKR
jgi:hypothetical protein